MEGEDGQAPPLQNMATSAQVSQQFVLPASAYPLVSRRALMDSSLTVLTVAAAAVADQDGAVDAVQESEAFSTYSCLKHNLDTARATTLWSRESTRVKSGRCKYQATWAVCSSNSSNRSVSDDEEGKDDYAQSRGSKPREF
ncbi:unnamed protein product [Hydatigera taeniaeformis]|uniref:Uncharacterized protein n=1 Tax=Hydatigena taeniaeformis TaxID=6205 RepID=A0A0R3WX41_HYDTA|nr:unnamed protein product [Hydatigera taeniaeformis]